MTPDSVCDLVRENYPQLQAKKREDGWTFFYQPRTSRSRIFSVMQSSANAPMRLLKGSTCRLGPGAKPSPFDGSIEQLRAIVDEEIREYEEHIGT